MTAGGGDRPDWQLDGQLRGTWGRENLMLAKLSWVTGWDSPLQWDTEVGDDSFPHGILKSYWRKRTGSTGSR